MINSQINRYRCQNGAERLEFADAESWPVKRRYSLSSNHTEKRGFMTRVCPKKGTKKCQSNEQTVSGALVRNNDKFESTDGIKVEVRKPQEAWMTMKQHSQLLSAGCGANV